MHPALRRGYKSCGVRADVGIGPYGCVAAIYTPHGRRRSHPCRARPARARVSGQRMAAQGRCENTAVNLHTPFAWQKLFRTGRILGAEGFQNLGFGGVL